MPIICGLNILKYEVAFLLTSGAFVVPFILFFIPITYDIKSYYNFILFSICTGFAVALLINICKIPISEHSLKEWNKLRGHSFSIFIFIVTSLVAINILKLTKEVSDWYNLISALIVIFLCARILIIDGENAYKLFVKIKNIQTSHNIQRENT